MFERIKQITTIFHQAQENRRALMGTLRMGARKLVVQSVREKLGLEISSPMALVDAEMILAHSGIPAEVFQASEELYEKRLSWSSEAGQESKRKQVLDRLQAERTTFDLEEAARHRAALKKLDEMALEIDRARDTWMVAFEASHRLLETAQPPEAIADLQQQLAAVTKQIETVERALNPQDRVDDLSYGWGSTADSPARLARQTRYALAEKTIGAERRDELNRQLASAESAIGDFKKRLTELSLDREEILEQLAYGTDALIPENFPMVMAKRPTLDERMKSTAVAAGWHDGPGVTVG